ncbi:MAG: hypothetical protein Q8R15_05240, partial [Candidatus Micrarchaeota archaeon]|nr:hypothetical protein [Candidatus Micrarchaeota archaeon]
MPILPAEIREANDYLSRHGKTSRWTPELTVAIHQAGLRNQIWPEALGRLCSHLEGLKPEQRQTILTSANAVLRSKGVVDAFQHLMEKARSTSGRPATPAPRLEPLSTEARRVRNVTPLPSFDEILQQGNREKPPARRDKPLELVRPRVQTPAPRSEPLSTVEEFKHLMEKASAVSGKPDTPLPTPAAVDTSESPPYYSPEARRQIFMSAGAGWDNIGRISRVFPHRESSHRIAQGIENGTVNLKTLEELRDVVINGWFGATAQKAADLLSEYHGHENKAVELLKRNQHNDAIEFLLGKAKEIFEPVSAPAESEARGKTREPSFNSRVDEAVHDEEVDINFDSPSIPQGAIVVKHEDLHANLKEDVKTVLKSRRYRRGSTIVDGMMGGLVGAASFFAINLPEKRLIPPTTQNLLGLTGVGAAVGGLLGYKVDSKLVRSNTRNTFSKTPSYGSIDASGEHKVEELRKTHPFAIINRKGDVILLPNTRFQRALHAAQ